MELIDTDFLIPLRGEIGSAILGFFSSPFFLSREAFSVDFVFFCNFNCAWARASCCFCLSCVITGIEGDRFIKFCFEVGGLITEVLGLGAAGPRPGDFNDTCLGAEAAAIGGTTMGGTTGAEGAANGAEDEVGEMSDE